MRSARYFLLALLGLCHCADPAPSGPVELCQLAGDEDGNGLVNVDDPACASMMAIVLRETCDSGEDDDGDGFTDCEDSECAMLDLCTKEQCDRPGDEDGNGLFNIDDPVCEGRPTLVEDCADQIDNDGDGRTDCEDSECLMARVCIPEDCIAPGDEDGDGKINCKDEDCREQGGFPACSSVETSRCSSSEPYVCQGGENTGVLSGFLHSCGDNNDNDFDGFEDCDDADCKDSCRCTRCEEICGNGIDDDEDSIIDNGCPCVIPNKTLGVCMMTRLNAFGECGYPDSYNPNMDTCDDRLDNDCDGSIDEGCPCDYKGFDVGVCADGVLLDSGVCGLPMGYSGEESNSLCSDGLDNDCDGLTDDDPECL